jgi:hypothetical protein
MDDDFDDYGSDISLYEESDEEESDGENVQDLNPTYLWTVRKLLSNNVQLQNYNYKPFIGLYCK